MQLRVRVWSDSKPMNFQLLHLKQRKPGQLRMTPFIKMCLKSYTYCSFTGHSEPSAALLWSVFHPYLCHSSHPPPLQYTHLGSEPYLTSPHFLGMPCHSRPQLSSYSLEYPPLPFLPVELYSSVNN